MSDIRNCPTCDSPAPNLHPAVQSEGEVQPCKDPWHTPPPRQEGMTRETFERTLDDRLQDNYPHMHNKKLLLAHDALQRETIRRLEQQAEMLKGCLEENRKHADQLQARLTASEAKGKWTSARPTVAGWYWWRFSVSTIPIIRCLLWDDDVQEFYDDVGTENKTLDELGGEWQGPLTPGEE